MRAALAAALAGIAVAAAPAHAGPDAAALVDAAAAVPGLRVDLRYATPDNFTKRAVYPKAARCYLRAGVAARLARVQALLAPRGLGLKVYDCYRPLSVQRDFWALVPDERYVARPDKGSRHNRGAAVDLTLVDAAGRELPMPTAFDDFTERAHRSYTKLPAAAIESRATLEQAMTAAGFVPMPTEWWHFDAPDSRDFPITDVPFEKLAKLGQPDKPAPPGAAK